ncbi:MAG: hypothetical protein H7259_00575 [Cytophagales bacterium]|nr:hypothetical protein [Cytophaga sp.]
MRNRRLILGLQHAGLNPDDFYTDLTDLILQKMGFENYYNEELCTWYEHTLEKLIDKDLRYFTDHQRDLASRMYELLEFKRKTMQDVDGIPFSMTHWGKEIIRKWRL